jgi:NitT/TauT family transport system permease protein
MTTQALEERVAEAPAAEPQVAAPRRRRPSRFRRFLGAAGWEIIPPAIAFAALIGAWALYVEINNTPAYIAPSPADVFDELTSRPRFYIDQGWYTLSNALIGLAIASAAALVLAIAMAEWRPVEKALFPVAILVKVTPIVALAPLFTIWWGFGDWPKIAIAALIAWFPLLVGGLIGFRSVDPAAMDFMRSIDASGRQVFLKLRLPSSLPYLAAGMRVALPLALIGAVVAEFFGSREGLGRLIAVSNANLDLATLFAAVIVLALIGVLLNFILTILERGLLGWHASQRT